MRFIGGTGTELYFQLVRNLGFAFFFWAALALPSAAFAWHGDFAPDNGSPLTLTTIGNLGWSVRGGLRPEARYLIIGCQGLPVEVLTKYFAWLDTVGVCLFFAYVLWFHFRHIPEADGMEEDEMFTPKDFSVEVDCLPARLPEQEQVQYEQELRDHLKRRLARMRKKHRDAVTDVIDRDICEITLVRDLQGRLGDITSRAELLRRRAIAVRRDEEKKVASLDKKIQKLSERLKRHLQAEEELPVTRAFVILNTPQDANYLLQDYRFAEYSLLRCCQYRNRRFHGHAIRVRQAPEPSNIVWANQDVPWFWRQVRVGLMNCVFLVIVIVAFGLVFAANAAAKGQSQTSHSFLGYDECDPSTAAYDPSQAGARYKCLVTDALSWTTAYAVNSGGDILDCYCAALGYAEIMKRSELRTACTGWLIEAGRAISIMAVCSTAIVAVNVAVRVILIYLAEVEKPLSMSQLNSSKMRKVAFAQTICTGFVITLVNYHHFPLGSFIFQGDYTDFTRGWYAAVGTPLLMSMLANTVGPSASYVATMLLTACRRYWCASRMKHQAELLELYTNPHFDLSIKYAQLLTTVVCTLTYSAGLPLLNLFAAMYMFATYWVDKVYLFRGARRPPHCDTQMPREASRYLIGAVALHCVFAIMMFGQACTFPSSDLGGALASVSSQATGAVNKRTTSSSDAVGWWSDRFSRESAWMHFALVLVLAALAVVWLVLWLLGSTLGQVLRGIVLAQTCCPVRVKTLPKETADRAVWGSAKDLIESILPPASYKLERAPEFNLLKPYLENDDYDPDPAPEGA